MKRTLTGSPPSVSKILARRMMDQSSHANRFVMLFKPLPQMFAKYLFPYLYFNKLQSILHSQNNLPHYHQASVYKFGKSARRTSGRMNHFQEIDIYMSSTQLENIKKHKENDTHNKSKHDRLHKDVESLQYTLRKRGSTLSHLIEPTSATLKTLQSDASSSAGFLHAEIPHKETRVSCTIKT